MELTSHETLEFLKKLSKRKRVVVNSNNLILPAYGICKRGSVFSIECGWVPLEALNKKERAEIITINELLDCEHLLEDRILRCNIHGDLEVINSISPSLRGMPDSESYCILSC